MNAAQHSRLEKADKPELYCSVKGCLWRVVTRKGPNPCQSHDPDAVAKRFWARVDQSTAEGCWTWTGVTRCSGTPWDYGRIKHGGRLVSAHRLSYELNVGKIGEGLKVLHRCDNPLCVRPDHLFLGTQLDNVQNMIAKGRKANWHRTTHCKHGHPWTPENTRIKPSTGTRFCVLCARERNRTSKNKRRKPGHAVPKVEAATEGEP